MRRIRCQYPTGEDFIAALLPTEKGLRVYTTERFEPGEEMLCEVCFAAMPGSKMIVRAIGKKWHIAQPRLRVRAGGVLRCIGSEWPKLVFLRDVAAGRTNFEQRRRFIRQPVLVEIRWRRSGESDLVPDTITEVSEVGALLLTPASIAIGEEIVVEITPPGSTRQLQIQAVVRNTDHVNGVGLEFVSRDMGGVTRLRELFRRIVNE